MCCFKFWEIFKTKVIRDLFNNKLIRENKPQFFILLLILLLSLAMYFLGGYKLIWGGSIFLLLSVQYGVIESGLLQALKKEKTKIYYYNLILGFLMFVFGTMAVLTYFLSGTSLDEFILFSIIAIFSIGILIFAFWKHLARHEKLISFFSLVAPILLISYLTLGNLIGTLVNSEINSLILYSQLILVVMLSLWFSNLFVRGLLEMFWVLLGSKDRILLNKAIHFDIGITLLVLVGGYFYLKYVSVEDLKDLFIILGILLSIWLATSPRFFNK